MRKENCEIEIEMRKKDGKRKPEKVLHMTRSLREVEYMLWTTLHLNQVLIQQGILLYLRERSIDHRTGFGKQARMEWTIC